MFLCIDKSWVTNSKNDKGYGNPLRKTNIYIALVNYRVSIWLNKLYLNIYLYVLFDIGERW